MSDVVTVQQSKASPGMPNDPRGWCPSEGRSRNESRGATTPALCASILMVAAGSDSYRWLPSK